MDIQKEVNAILDQSKVHLSINEQELKVDIPGRYALEIICAQENVIEVKETRRIVLKLQDCSTGIIC